MTTLNSTKAPNLPVATTAYETRYQEQLNNVQRLYYNQIDNVTQNLLGPLGGQYINNPHISASDSTDQYASATNTPTIVKWNTLDSGAGFTLNPPGTATCLATGIFKITYSAQMANTANAAHDAVFWLKVNNVDVPNSTTVFTIPARKSAGVPSYLVAYSEVTFTVRSGDVVALYWATNQAYNPVGPVDGVYIEHLPVQTTPYARPAAPSVIGSITFVSSTAT